jgi:hypothetical protein
MRTGFVLAGLAAVLAMTACAAADPGLEAAIAACAAKTDTTVRLACYDGVAAQLKTAPVASEAAAPAAAAAVAQPPRAKPAAPTTADFGGEFIEQKQKEAVAAETPDGPDEIRAKVVAIEFAGNGRFTVTLDNGQVWRQVQGDGEPKRLAKRAGTMVTVAHGFWKSYNLNFDEGGNTYKVVRDK